MLIDIFFNMENTTRACEIFTYYCLTIGIRNIIFYSVNKPTYYMTIQYKTLRAISNTNNNKN